MDCKKPLGKTKVKKILILYIERESGNENCFKKAAIAKTTTNYLITSKSILDDVGYYISNTTNLCPVFR